MNAPDRKEPADHEARQRVLSELDTCFLVEAAAGTGKTTLLIDRIMSLLRQERASLAEVAAITFTEKAAGELKVRLREAIERALRRGSGAQQKMRAALVELDSMTVSTIHGFCAELIRERPVEAGVDPNFSVADELECSLIFEEAWDEWLAEQMSFDNSALRRAIEIGIRFQEAGDHGLTLPGLARILIEKRDVLPSLYMAERWPPSRLAEAAEHIRAAVAGLVTAVASDCSSPGEDKGAQQISRLRDWSARFAGPDVDEMISWLRARPAIKSRLGSQTNWATKSGLIEVKAGLGQLKATVESAWANVTHGILCDLVDLVLPFVARFSEAKARRRKLDFVDLLLVARDMLAHSRPARDYFKRAYRYILVDEFQDTDPLQAEIVFFLSEERNRHAPDWESVSLQPGKLFIVGDPKQSIYRFRRADLDLYSKVKQSIARQGEVINLSVNFRTVPKILTEANAVFKPLMTGPVDGRYEPEHVELIPFREASNKDAGVRLLCPPAGMPTEALKADDWRRKESGCIAAFLRDAVERAIEVHDVETGHPRPVAYRDIAILYRNTTGLQALEDALRAHDVPYQVAGGRHYYTRLEFQDLLCVLRAVENPYDALNVVGALRSPFFGHSDEDILGHFLAGGVFNYLKPSPPECSALADAFEVFMELHRLRTANSAASVLAELFERTQALQIYAMKPHGQQRVANLLKVQDIARTLAGSGLTSFGGLVRWLAQMENRRQAEGESPVAEAHDNFVRLMTLHSAKGLEFPVVVLANLGAKDARSETHVLDRTTRRLALNFGRAANTLDWAEAFQDERDRQEHERRRLFYVAMTRARDLLVLPAYWWPSAQAGFLGYIGDRYPRTDQGQACCDDTDAQPVATESYDIDKKSRDAFRLRPTLGESLPKVAEEFWQHRTNWKASLEERARQLNSARTIITATREMAEESFELNRSEFPSGGSEAASAMDLGSLVHKLIEIADPSASEESIQSLADALAREYDLPPDDAGIATRLAKRALDHPLLKERAASAKEMHREVPFCVNYGDQLLEGAVDLLFVEDDGAVIVDYKTNDVTEEEAAAAAERYRPQAEIYARAMTAALGVPIKEVTFLFLRPGKAVALDV